MPEIEIICQLLSNQHSDYVRHQIQQDLIHIFKYFVEITHCFYMPHREREIYMPERWLCLSYSAFLEEDCKEYKAKMLTFYN